MTYGEKRKTSIVKENKYKNIVKQKTNIKQEQKKIAIALKHFKHKTIRSTCFYLNGGDDLQRLDFCDVEM